MGRDGTAPARIAAAVRDRPPVGGLRLVTVDGFSGAGKSRLTGRLTRFLDRAPSVHLDFFYPGWNGLSAVADLAVRWVAEPLAAGRAARWRRYDWVAGAFAEWCETPWAPFVVLEGCGAGAAAPATPAPLSLHGKLRQRPSYNEKVCIIQQIVLWLYKFFFSI